MLRPVRSAAVPRAGFALEDAMALPRMVRVLPALALVACSSAAASHDEPARAAPQPVLLEDGIKNAYPRWSRDGARILFQSNRTGHWQLEVMDADGSHRRQLTHGPSNNNFPDWSPDNQRIAFVSDRDGDEDVFVMDTEGADARNLTRHPGRDIHPYWSQDGRRILFSSTRDVGRFQLYEMDAEGGDQLRMVSSPDDDTCARVAPDGARIVYLTNLARGQDDVLVARRDGGGPVNVTDDAQPDGWPCWTPDGTRLVYAAGEYGAFALRDMRADGSERRVLDAPPAGWSDARPAVSPDGRRVAFNRDRGETIGIFVLELPAAGIVRAAEPAHTLHFEEGRITFDGRTIEFPASPESVAQLLGPPSRTFEKSNVIDVWDELGLRTYRRGEPSQVIEMNVDFEPGTYHFSPRSSFCGEVMLVGRCITPRTTADQLSRTGLPVQRGALEDWSVKLRPYTLGVGVEEDRLTDVWFSWHPPHNHVPGPPLAPDELFVADSRAYQFPFDESFREVERRGHVSVLRHEIHGKGGVLGRSFFAMGAMGELGRRLGFRYMVVLADRPIAGDWEQDPRVFEQVVGFLNDPDADLSLEFPADFAAGETSEIMPTDFILDVLPGWPDGGVAQGEG
jgi:TolB protein